MSAAEQPSKPQLQLWYVRRGATVRGPFRVAVIKRYLVLGRVRVDDELSNDRKSWVAAADCPPFSSDGIAPVALGRADEERDTQDSRAEPQDVTARRQRRERVLASLRPDRRNNVFPAIGVALAVVTIGAFAYLAGPGDPSALPSCNAPAAPAVNWSNCQKQRANFSKADLSNALLRNARLTQAEFLGTRLRGADLAYADLSGAFFGYSDLQGARLTGANLQRSDFAYANLRAADLSYADLRDAILGGADLEGARFDHALWLDGRRCLPRSVGTCL